MENKSLKVHVIGLPNSGKTTVAHVIKAALDEQGFTSVKIKDTDPTPNKEHISKRIEATKTRPIEIEVWQVRGEVRGDGMKLDLSRLEQVLKNAREWVRIFASPTDPVAQSVLKELDDSVAAMQDFRQRKIGA